MSELSPRTKFFMESLLKIIITVVAAAVPLFIANQINTTQKMKEFVQLYDLINTERSVETKKELLSLWAEMNPGRKAEATIVTLLESIEESTQVLAANTKQTLEAMRSLNDQLTDRGSLSAEQLNQLNTNLEQYYVFQGLVMDEYNLSSRFSEIPKAPVYVESEEARTLQEILESSRPSRELPPDILQSLGGSQPPPAMFQNYQGLSAPLNLQDSRALKQALPGWDFSGN
ncbi:hypothetical protein [Salinispira pacifica]|uniref:Uncharacterized protein n=1 Tax=Salinispira pacifica TaxID=1307761 RepID=V5WH28_9SPIO|nr:hypothetical protein [Salinispira pacifica]AHC14935.1 hypothetical protein L21SP2_1542 [Salinispira pacifica]